MQVRDAAGRQVSLLNDDISYSTYDVPPQRLAYRTSSHMSAASYHGSYGRSPSPFPNTPELLRSDSYDSQISNEPISPLTPMYEYGRGYAAEARSPYEEYYGDQQFLQQQQAQTFAKNGASLTGSDGRSVSYEDDAASGGNVANTGKRYPCRYRDSHGCEKTFTTSGHASRHSKIHTAEKAVQCTFAGCTKKFTRADNMKQHLETHYKDKSRSSGSSRPSLGSERKSSSSASGKSSRSSKSSSSAAAPLPSPGARAGAWDMRGLDALAMAVACQEGA